MPLPTGCMHCIAEPSQGRVGRECGGAGITGYMCITSFHISCKIILRSGGGVRHGENIHAGEYQTRCENQQYSERGFLYKIQFQNTLSSFRQKPSSDKYVRYSPGTSFDYRKKCVLFCKMRTVEVR